jgi:tetratricopeptide (TPR) repeat protein
MAGKLITEEQQRGKRGQTLAQLLVEEMGHVYHPASENEAGIDGFIELRSGLTGSVDAQMVGCQVKTGESAIFHESETEFSWRAEPGDLVYWENSNLPVIVIVLRLAKREGWWRAVDEAFPTEADRAKRVVRFDKARDRLNGAPGEVLFDVVGRDRERRAIAARMAMVGPYATIGLSADLDAAVKHERERRWLQAASAWEALADVATAKGLERRLVWPARQAAARSLHAAGRRTEAGELLLALAAERVDDDDPDASFDIHRAQWTAAWAGSFAQTLTAVRANLPEAGIDALDDLRAVVRMAFKASERQAAAAALVDALIFFGEWEEALVVAGRVLGKRNDTAHKRQLVLDRFDCAGELGGEVEDDWRALLADWRDRGPHLYGRALQRRAVFALRRGDPDEARRCFAEAAEVWARTEGGEEQVAEVALSAALVGDLSGQLEDTMPPGARAAAAIARGSIRTPAVRSDLLVHAGLAFLVNGQRPDAIKRLTLAAMVDRRAGNLFSWRRSATHLARAYEDADEYPEALRFWLLIGAERQAATVAPKVDADVVRRLIRVDKSPAWEQAAGLAALEHHAEGLSEDVVASIAPLLIAAAEPTPMLAAPQPSFYARRTLALVCDRLPARSARRAGELLAEDIRRQAPNAPESSRGLVVLTQRGLFEGVPVIVEALLAGNQLPVTVQRWLRDTDDEVRRPLVDAALAGNRIALAEVAAADLPANDDRLRQACDEAIISVVTSERPHDREVIGMSFTDLADLARFASPATQGHFADFLVDDVITGARYDEVSKTSALITIALAAPGLSTPVAERTLASLLPIAAGAPVQSSPAVISDHPNPKRARTLLTREAPPGGVRAAAVQACGRLARVAGPDSLAVDAMLHEALESGQTEVARMALRELAGLLQLGTDVDAAIWQAHPEPSVRAAGEQLALARRGEPTTD